MIKDVSILLDESLGSLRELSKLQTEKATHVTQTPGYQQDKVRPLEDRTSGWISLGNSAVDILVKLLKETKGTFITPENVDGLATMLCCNLEALTGQSYQELKVKDPEKYGFNPKQLLFNILTFFINLIGEPTFVTALAKCNYFSRVLIVQATGIAIKRGLLTEVEVRQLHSLVEQVSQQRLTVRQGGAGAILKPIGNCLPKVIL
jgi:ubiquitin conjugation factor E4 B